MDNSKIYNNLKNKYNTSIFKNNQQIEKLNNTIKSLKDNLQNLDVLILQKQSENTILNDELVSKKKQNNFVEELNKQVLLSNNKEMNQSKQLRTELYNMKINNNNIIQQFNN